MLDHHVHPTDEELLLAADGELSNHRARQLNRHLADCWECRARVTELEATIAGFMRAHRQTAKLQLPAITGSQALLAARLNELASSPPGNARSFVRWRASRLNISIAIGGVFCVAFTLIAALAIRSYRFTTHVASSTLVPYLEQGATPNPNLTPGATHTVSVNDVCSMEHEQVVGQVSLSLRQQVLKEYGITQANPSEYEIDYLIAPGLGGTEDIHNLWPEPYTSPTWNAYAKDALEEHLHHLVCAGKLDITTAQRDIATDWIAAYKKYFHTENPLPARSPRPILHSTKYSS